VKRKSELQNINAPHGQTKAVQLPVADWERVLNKIKKYEQALRLKSDLKEALDQVRELKSGKAKKQTLNRR